MPPPPSYLDITSTPFQRTITVAEFNGGTFGGVANECWFRYVTGASPVAFGWFNGLATGYSPATNLYQSDGSTLIKGNTGDNAMWWPLPNNSTFYIRLRNNLGGGIVIGVIVLFESEPIGNLGTIPDGSWLINDDGVSSGTTGFPSAVYGPDGAFIGFIGTLPAGEIGDSLPNRVSLWHDRFGMYGGELSLFDANFLFVDDFTPVPSLGARFPNICNDGTKFFILNRTTNGVFTITAAGVMSGVIATLPFLNDIQAMGVSRNGTLAYWAEGYDSGRIGQENLSTDAPLPDLYVIPGFVAGVDYVAITAVNNQPGEILVLVDGTIATFWFDWSAQVNHILHIAADGTLLQDLSFPVVPYGLIDHIHYSPTGAGAIYVWFFTNVTAKQGRFGSVTFATGAFSQLFETDLLSVGGNLVGGSGTIFGPSASCSLTTIGYPGEEPPPPPPTTAVCPPVAWLLPAASGCVAIGELPDNSA